MENTESNIKYLKDEPIKKAIAHLSIPMMIGMSAGTIYNVGNMFGVGGGTFITRLVAKNEDEKAKKVAGYTFMQV